MLKNAVKRIARKFSRRNMVIVYPSFFCNYKCPYCVIRKSKRLNDYPRESEHSWKEWADALNRLPPSDVSFSGGETLLFPGMVSLIQSLALKHKVFLTTNLSSLPDELVECRLRERLVITASFHPVEADYDSFKERLKILKNSGFKVFVEMVAYPRFLKDVEHYLKRFKMETGITVNVDPYITPEYRYTSDDLMILKKLGIYNRRFGFDFAGKGVLKECKAGMRHFVMVPNGDVFACHAGFYYVTSPLHLEFRARKEDFYLGNIFLDTFKIRKELTHCFMPCSEACDLDGADVREIKKAS
jgi:MoaA/NifB/PqqE/SkfB family radical SAM enzyme